MTNLIITADGLDFSPYKQSFAIPLEMALYSQLDALENQIVLYMAQGGNIYFTNTTNPPTIDYLRPALNQAFAAKPGQGDIELANFLPADFLDGLVVSNI